MSPTRDHGRGSFVLDRVLPGVGRLKVASGTTSAQTFRRLNGMIDALKGAGRLDVLQAIHDRVVTPLEVWSAFREHDLDRLPSADTIRRLWPAPTSDGEPELPGALEAWRRDVKGTKHKDAMRTSFAQLRKLSRAEANVGELPELLARYRAACEKQGHARSFNLARSHVQAFLRDSLGRSHRLYRKVQDLQTLPVTRAEGKPLTVPQLAALIAALAPKDAAIAHDMALTGMGPSEFWGRWELLEDRVVIYGTKRAARRRVIPRLGTITRPDRHPRTFQNAMQRAPGGHTPYDLRRTFAHIMEEAGIPRARRKLYLGHAAGDVTDLYERHEVESYLARDREALLSYIDTERQRATEEA